jgi:hypothetical protein
MAAAALGERAGTHDKGPYGEPAGSKAGPSSPKRRFAIQRHDATCTTTCASSPAALEGDPHDGLKRGDLKFSLEGERLHGSWVLVRMKQVVASMPSDNEATADQPER